jgi:hypothetical protein
VLARGSHNMILFNSFNKFSIKLHSFNIRYLFLTGHCVAFINELCVKWCFNYLIWLDDQTTCHKWLFLWFVTNEILVIILYYLDDYQFMICQDWFTLTMVAVKTKVSWYLWSDHGLCSSVSTFFKTFPKNDEWFVQMGDESF